MGDKSRFPPLVGSPFVTGDKNLLISIILNGMQGPLKVGDKTFSSIMPPHKEMLDDHAVASICTYIRRRFGKITGPVKATEVAAIRNPGGKTRVTSKDDTALIRQTKDFTITGKGDDPAWSKASWLPFTKIDSAGRNYSSKSKMLYSKKGLYLLFAGEDDRISTKSYKDDQEIYEGDVFEFFLQTDPAKPPYFEYEINQMGRQLTLTLARFPHKNLAWSPWSYEYEQDPLIQKKVIINGGTQKPGEKIRSWSAEIFFPYELLGLLPGIPPHSGTTWQANFCRIDYDIGKMVQWSWSKKIKSSFHELEHFGTIIFE